METAPETSTLEPLFSKQMRDATRGIHSVSDALVNAKLGFAMSNDRVWCEGLMAFREVFVFLEEAMAREPQLRPFWEIPGLRRGHLFLKDLRHYLGPGWTPPTPSPPVAAYLKHLQSLPPEMLLPYVYHLYMGLLSGGQVMRRKRVLVNRVRFSAKGSYAGLAVTEVEGSVAALKTALRDATNATAAAWGPETRQAALRESQRVFELNNAVVAGIEGVGGVLAGRLLWCLSVLLLAWLLARLLW